MDASLYVRPSKPMHKPVGQRNWRNQVATHVTRIEPVVVDAATECHVTPSDIAKRMVELLGIDNGTVCEPQAGTGSLIQALLEYSVNPSDITAIERHVTLAECLRNRFDDSVRVENQCFLEYALQTKQRFNHLVLNPPFRYWKQHLKSAKALLSNSPGDSIVALLPVTAEMEGFVEVEKLPIDTFQSAKVHTKIMRYRC